MDWSPQQDRALASVASWIRDPGDQQLFRLFGYAGTGKTTLARHLASGLDGSVLFAAYTGKAASVLRAAGAPNAQTLHSLIYQPREKSRARLSELRQQLDELEQAMAESPKEEWDPGWADQKMRLRGEIKAEENNNKRPDFTLKLESPLSSASLLVVDECSMVDEQMAMDILSFRCPVLVLGDPAQLPPVRGTGYFTDAEPDVMLTEIHRQAKGDPIVALATKIRMGERLDYGTWGETSIIQRATPELALAADQVLVGLNLTRVSTNRRMRELLGHTGPWPRCGEKLVCLRNERELGLLNGTMWISTTDADYGGGYVGLRVRPEDAPEAEPLPVTAHPEHFEGDPEKIGYWDRRNAQEFTFGYALTTHKAQGSQWGRVLVIDESGAFRDRDTMRRWLYTAVTRAQKSLTLVRS